MKKIEDEKVEWSYQCQKCGAIIRTTHHQKIPIPPDECWEDQGGCGRKPKFIDITNELLHRKIEQLEKQLKEIQS